MIGELGSFSGNFSRPVLESTFYVSGQSYAGIIFSFEKITYQAFAEIGRKNIGGQSGKFSNGVVKPALYIGQKIILKRVYKFGSSKLFFICRYWDEIYQPVRETLIAGVKTALYVFRGTVWGTLFLEEKNRSSFGPRLENLDFMGEILRQGW